MAEQETNETLIRISVRTLVTFLLTRGDITRGHSLKQEREAMQLGQKIHRKIQKSMPVSYKAEVPLAVELKKDGYSLLVEGRADGIWQKEDGVVIDEIKGTFASFDHLNEPDPLHLAQARCYAYIFSLDNRLPNITVQITYAHLKTEEIRRFSFLYTFEELEQFFKDLITAYEPWCRFTIDHRKECIDSASALSFPYPYREGQWDTIRSVYHTLIRSRRLFLQAPTGSGKTLAVLYPSIKAIGEGEGEKIFYLTARTAARATACDTFSLLKERGLRMKVLLLTAKERICPLSECVCDAQTCDRARGHYDRVRDAVYELLTTEDLFFRDTIDAHAQKHQVCPFEMELDLSLWCDAIICDYNYVFDPQARLRRYFGEHKKGDYFFLVDEAHNLVDRGREMFSAHLCKEEFLRIRRLLPKSALSLTRALNRCNQWLLQTRRNAEDAISELTDLGTFPISLFNLSGELELFLEDLKDEALATELLSFYFDILTFTGACDRLDDSYLIYTEQTADAFFIHLLCVETSRHLLEPLALGKGTVYFSATLLPITYYKQLLGETEDYAIYARTAFAPENKRILAAVDISTRYKDRNALSYERIVSYIRTTILSRSGNYMAFFPSYQMAEAVADLLRNQIPEEIPILLQQPGMAEQERDAFLEQFQQTSPLLGICIMGGIFGEAIDLRGDSLIGVIVVGPGLPQICPERELLKNYYIRKKMDGFFYAYLCPGMNKVLQAAGRVIRTEEDKGVIVLLDDRFSQPAYRQMFPREWQELYYCTQENFLPTITEFWDPT